LRNKGLDDREREFQVKMQELITIQINERGEGK
jgi:hypothetical protein